MGPIEVARPRLVPALKEALAVYDLPTGEHSTRAGALARAVGAVLGLDEASLEALTHAGTLHDLGKLGVPERILAKPGPLDGTEWQAIKRHPSIGADLVRSCSPGATDSYCHHLEAVAAGIETHHERWDGSGYPLGSGGEETPLSGRILALVDVYDSMTQERSYRRRHYTSDEVLSYLEAESGKLFDPMIVPIVVGVARRR